MGWHGMGWDKTGMNCYGMGWDGTEKNVPWTSLEFIDTLQLDAVVILARR